MKNLILAISTFVLLSFSNTLAQFSLNGSLQSSLYTFERTDDLRQANFYQGFNLRLAHGSLANTYLNTNFRMIKFGDQSWDEKVYNTYLNWKTASNLVSVRAGRQFLYQGVMNGTFDGVLLAVNPVENLSIKVFGGLEAPFDRDFRTVESDSSAIGGILSYRLPWDIKVDVSYMNQKRDDESILELAGLALSGNYDNSLYYVIQADQDLINDEIQKLRGRFHYLFDKWTFIAEVAQQKPRIYQDSFFRIFSIEEYSQMRGGLTYQLDMVQLGAQYILTNYENDSNNRIIVTGATDWGMIGVIFQSGYAGDNVGVYGDLRYKVMPELTLKAYSSYYNYERGTKDISEDAVSFSAGAEYRPLDSIILMADVQESMNSYFKNDLRGLFRFNYFFNFKSE